MRWMAFFLIALGIFPGVLRSQETADPIADLRTKAEAGDTASQRELAARYAEGEGVPQDAARSRSWYQRAAEAGDAEAQTALGLMLADSESGTANPTQGLQWISRAADQGYAPAQYWMGWMYLTGRGVESDPTLAAKWWRKAAEQGHASSQNNLGLLYEEGIGVPQDLIEAYAWLSLAGVTSLSPLEEKMNPDQISKAWQRVRELKTAYAEMTNDEAPRPEDQVPEIKIQLPTSNDQ